MYNHAVRIIDELDTMRDLVNSALEVHTSVVANRQSDIVAQLTAVATFLMPLTYIVGFFGMNFSYLTHFITGGATFFWLGIATQLVAIIGIVVLTKLKSWF